MPHAKATAAAIPMIDAIRQRSAAISGPWLGKDADEAIAFVKANPRISDSIVAAQPAAKLAPHALLAALHYHCAERDPEEADQFFSDLASGGDLKGAPVFVLRKKLADDIRRRAQRREAPNRWNIGAWVTLAWNARRQGKPLIKFPPHLLDTDAEGEPQLPIIE